MTMVGHGEGGAMMATAIFIGLWTTMLLAGDCAIGRVMRDWLVVRPAARLAWIRRGHVLLATALTLLGTLAWWFGSADGLGAFSVGVPDLALALSTFEVSAYLDLLATGLVALSALRSRGVAAFVRQMVRSARRLSGRRRDRRRRSSASQPANDDERRPTMLAAA